MPPKSHSRVHCSYCPACTHPKGPSECLKDPVWNKKCKANKRKDDLKSHNEAVHQSKAPAYVGQIQSASLSSFVTRNDGLNSPPKKKGKIFEQVLENPSTDNVINIAQEVPEETSDDNVFSIEDETVELISSKQKKNTLIRLFKEGFDEITNKLDRLLLRGQSTNQTSI